MRAIIAIVLVFGFLAWDMTKNQGQYTRSINASIGDLVHVANLR